MSNAPTHPPVRTNARSKSAAARVTPIYQRALALHRRGELRQADLLYREVLEIQPDYPDALHMLGVVAAQAGQPEQGIALIGRALQLDPLQAGAHSSLGNALRDLKRPLDALKHFDRALELDPEHSASLNNRGSALLDLRRPQEALENYERALCLKPDHVGALCNRGNALMQLNRAEEALESYERAVQLAANFAPALCARSSALLTLQRYREALTGFTHTLRLDPNNVAALLGRGKALRALRQLNESLDALERCLAVDPVNAEAHHHRGSALLELRRMAEAVASFDDVLLLEPESTDSWYGRGIALAELGDHEQAAASYAKVLELAPGFPYALGGLVQAKLQSCDWTDWTQRVDQLATAARLGIPACIPWTFLAVSESAAAQLQCARIYADNIFPVGPTPAARSPSGEEERIRVAYLSADFREHPVAQLLAGVLEKHDPEHFETLVVSLRPLDASSLGQRIKAAAGIFLDASLESDASVAATLRQHRVDIAIDLQGFTHGMRTGILAHRAAPVQVNYLGYPGTMGAGYIDYIIGDPVVIPEEAGEDYSERIVRLPDCYLPFDDLQPGAPPAPSRLDAGLPSEGFVFCAFNNHYKITPALFDVWMRLLLETPGSVLWLRAAGATAISNLRREAVARGVAEDRLVVAPWVAGVEAHLARQQLADLFLDTSPYNAHATALHALWAGVPVLTCRGATFAGRVGASLLQAVGLPEMIAGDLQTYERRALELAADPAALSRIRTKLAVGRRMQALFNTERYCSNLEAAFRAMHDRQRRGESPANMSIPAAGIGKP